MNLLALHFGLMEPWMWIAAGALLLMLLLLLAVRRASAGKVDPTQLLLSPTLMSQVRQLAASGQRLPAIVLLRDGTPGLGLTPAKAIVDRMVAASIPPGLTVSRRNQAPKVYPPASTAAGVDPALLVKVRWLRSNGKDIDAIKLFRQRTGCGLREAKDFVMKL